MGAKLALFLLSADMEIKTTGKIKTQVKSVFEPRLKRPLTEEEVSEAVFNLRGFGLTLLKMKKELKND